MAMGIGKKAVLVALASLPLVGAASQPLPAGWGSCDYSAEDSKSKGLTYCNHVQDEAHCLAAAAAKTSKAWTQEHPPKFTSGVRCDAKSQAKTAKKASKEKASSSSASAGSPAKP